MESKRKSNSIIAYLIDVVAGRKVIRFTVGDQTFTVDPEQITPENRERALFHGLVQKISDRAAIGRDPETGASASPEDKFAAMKETAERLMAGGPWNAQATGTGSAGGVLYRAMRNLYPNAWSDRKAFAEYIKGKAVSETERLGKAVSEADVRAGLMAVKKIGKEIDRIRAEEGKAVPVNAGEWLQELEAK